MSSWFFNPLTIDAGAHSALLWQPYISGNWIFKSNIESMKIKDIGHLLLIFKMVMFPSPSNATTYWTSIERHSYCTIWRLQRNRVTQWYWLPEITDLLWLGVKLIEFLLYNNEDWSKLGWDFELTLHLWVVKRCRVW